MASIDALNLLLENGADVNSTNRSGLSIFDHIVSADHVDLLEILWNEALAYDKSRDTKMKASAGLIHQAAGSLGSDCLEYILNRHPAGKKSVVMEYNNYFE